MLWPKIHPNIAVSVTTAPYLFSTITDAASILLSIVIVERHDVARASASQPVIPIAGSTPFRCAVCGGRVGRVGRVYLIMGESVSDSSPLIVIVVVVPIDITEIQYTHILTCDVVLEQEPKTRRGVLCGVAGAHPRRSLFLHLWSPIKERHVKARRTDVTELVIRRPVAEVLR